MRLLPLSAPLPLLALLFLLPHTAYALETGTMAPDFRLSGLRAQDGATVQLSAQRGKVVYVDFWASWCPPCLVSIPLLGELRNRLVSEGKPFEIVAVNVDTDPDDGRDFLADEPVDYLAVSDPEGETPARYELPGMPTSFLLDAQGRIRLIHTGFKPADIEMLEAEIRKLLDALP